MSLNDEQRHDRILAWLQAHDKPTKVFHSKWTPACGDLINAKVLTSTPVFWYKKSGWSRADIEAMFFDAHIEIKSGDCFDRSLQEIFGGSPGKRWNNFQVEKPKSWHNDNVDNTELEAKSELKLTPKADDVWNALSNFGEINSVNFRQFQHNMKERGIQMPAQLAETIFIQIANSDSSDGSITRKKMDKLLQRLELVQVPDDMDNITCADLEDDIDIGKLNVLLKRLFTALCMEHPFNVADFLSQSAHSKYIPQPYSLDDWNTLVLRFAPKCYLYSEDDGAKSEEWLPSNIDYFLQRCTLRQTDNANFSIEQPSRAQIAQYTDKSYFLDPKDYLDTGVFSGYLPGASHYVRIQTAGAPVYGQNMIDLQYYLFYPYNGYAYPYQKIGGAHEGDWEFVAVRLANWQYGPREAIISAVLNSRHGHAESVWLTQPATPGIKYKLRGYYMVEDGTHPVVYVAHGTHCNYEFGGKKYRSGYDEDVCASEKNLPWNYPTSISTEGNREDVVEIIEVEDDVYSVFDHTVVAPKVPPQDWITYGGTWGEETTHLHIDKLTKVPPETPHHNYYNFTDGYSAAFVDLAPYGSDWYKSVGTGSVALGMLGVFGVLNSTDFCLAVGIRPHHQDNDYLLVLYSGVIGGDGNLTRLAKTATGRSSSHTSGVQCVAIGPLAEWWKGLVGLAWNTTEGGSRFELYERDTLKSLRRVYVGGQNWNSTFIFAIAFGFVGDGEGDRENEDEDDDGDDGKEDDEEEEATGKKNWIQVFGVCPGGTVETNKVFMLYTWPKGASEPQELAYGDLSDFGAPANYARSIAFGSIGGKKVVAIGRAAIFSSDARLHLYYYDSDTRKLVLWIRALDGLPQNVYVNSVDVGVMNDEQVVGVTTSAGVLGSEWGDGTTTACFFLYRVAIGGIGIGFHLELVHAGGLNWSGNATNISFGESHSTQFFAVGRWQGGQYTKLMWYDSGFNEAAVAGGDWGDDRGTTSVAVGWLNVGTGTKSWEKEAVSVIAYGRNPGNDTRGGVFRWSTPK